MSDQSTDPSPVTDLAQPRAALGNMPEVIDLPPGRVAATGVAP